MKLFILLFFSLLLTEANSQPSSLTPKIISYISNTNLSSRDVHSDCEGNVVYVGGTGDGGFVITNGTVSSKYNGGKSDAFIFKIDSSGNKLWSTLIGGNLYDRAYAVEIDKEGFIYISGRAGTGLKTTSCALQQSFAGDNNPNSAYGIQDGFITKLTPDGKNLVWSTYIGCDGRGFVRDIDIDSKGNVWAGISNASPNFPYITKNAVQKTTAASMSPALIKLSADGKTLLYGTFLSDGVANSAGPTTVRIDKNDNVYFLSHASTNNIPITNGVFQNKVAGNNDFVVSKFDSTGNLIFCTFLGGPGNEEVETHSLEIDTSGNVIVAAYTYGSGYPVTNNVLQTTFGGVRDGVITKIAKDGSKILASTYFGGTLLDEVEGIGIDKDDNIYVTGTTLSHDFPITNGISFQSKKGSDLSDGHISVLSSDLSTLLYGTFIGGSGSDNLRSCHVDEQGKVYSCGSSGSANFPIINSFDKTLTGTLTGTAVVFAPKVLYETNTKCEITNEFINPCLDGTNIENSEPNQVSIYPNPSSVIISLELGIIDIADLVIYDILGNEIMNIPSYRNKSEINISKLSKGTYTIQLRSNDKFTTQILIVSQ